MTVYLQKIQFKQKNKTKQTYSSNDQKLQFDHIRMWNANVYLCVGKNERWEDIEKVRMKNEDQDKILGT